MKLRRLQKFVLSFGIILSLFSSSFAVCVCSHHAAAATKTPDHAPSCHQTAQPKTDTQVSESDSKNKFPVVEENCGCFVKLSQPFVVGKSENVKTQKTPVILPFEIKAEHYDLVSENEPAKIHFEYHFYNSNYLRKLTPPRAPPVL